MSGIKTFTGGEFGENTYIFRVDDGLAMVDPGADVEKLTRYISGTGRSVRSILLTHGHVDHICSVSCAKNASVYAHEDEKELLSSPQMNLSALTGISVDMPRVSFYSGSVYSSGPFVFYHTPGHTAGSVVIAYKNSLFTGDTLFLDTIGRCDLPGGDPGMMKESLRLFDRFGRDTVCYPGHGIPFTLEQCFASNFFLRR